MTGYISADDLQCDLCSSRAHEHLHGSNDGDYVRCLDCGLIYGTADDSGLAEAYNTEYAALLGPERAGRLRRTPRWVRKANRRVRNLEPERSTGNFLEIGCAYGDFLKVVDNHGWNTTGIELSDTAAEHARRVHGLDARTGTVESLFDDLPAGQFDVIWAANLLEHLVSPTTFFEHIRTLLRPGGLFVGSTLNYDSWGYRYAGPKWEYTHSTRIHRFVFGKETLKRYSREAGFEFEKFETYGFKFVSKYAPKSWYSPAVRFAEQGVATVARGLNQGHRIELYCRRPANAVAPAMETPAIAEGGDEPSSPIAATIKLDREQPVSRAA